MLQFNLLPEEEKIEFKNILKFRFAIFFSIWFFFCFLSFLLILIFSNYYLKIQTSNLEKKISFEKNEIQEQEIKDFENISLEINKNLLKIQEIKNKSLPIYEILKDLVFKSSAGRANQIKFQSIIFLPSLKEISIIGFAINRDELLKFKSNIESSQYVQLVDLPIHFLAKQENIDFVLKIKIK